MLFLTKIDQGDKITARGSRGSICGVRVVTETIDNNSISAILGPIFSYM